MATKPVVGAGEGAGPERVTGTADIRSASVLPSRIQLRALVRRCISVAALVAIDLGGLAGALYLALVLRELYYGDRPVLWGIPWDAEENWLPFLMVVTVLVFWQAGLYAPRERRAGVGRIVSSLLLVTVVTLAFSVGTGYQHSTFGLYATGFVLSAIVIGLLRASYEVVTADLWRVAGVRRRALLVGEGDQLVSLRRAIGRGRSGIDYEFVGVLGSTADGDGLRVLGRLEDLAAALEEHRPDELIVSGSGLGEEELLDLVDEAHRAGVKVRIAPTMTELLTQRAEYVPGQGVPLFELRPPVFAGLDWTVKRAFDVAVSTAMIVLASPFWAVIALAVKLSSPGPVFYRDRRVGLGEQEFGMFKFRSMYVDVEPAAGGARGLERGVGAAVQDQGRPARHARRQVPAPLLARRAARRC